MLVDQACSPVQLGQPHIEPHRIGFLPALHPPLRLGHADVDALDVLVLASALSVHAARIAIDPADQDELVRGQLLPRPGRCRHADNLRSLPAHPPVICPNRYSIASGVGLKAPGRHSLPPVVAFAAVATHRNGAAVESLARAPPPAWGPWSCGLPCRFPGPSSPCYRSTPERGRTRLATAFASSWKISPAGCTHPWPPRPCPGRDPFGSWSGRRARPSPRWRARCWGKHRTPTVGGWPHSPAGPAE